MPSIINSQNPETKVLEKNNQYLQNYAIRAGNAFTLLSNYNFNGSGAMPDFTWVSPNGASFEYININGELSLNSVGFTSLSPPDKRIFFQYLTKFVGECIKNYNETYGL